MKRINIQFLILLICVHLTSNISAQSKRQNDSSFTKKVVLKFSKAFKNFSGNQAYLYGGIGFNKQNVNESSYTSAFNYRYSDVNNNVYKPGYFAGFRFDGNYKLKHKYSFAIGFNKISSGIRYSSTKRMDPIVGEFTNFKADNQFFMLHLAAHYKHLLPFADSAKHKFYIVAGPSIDIRLSNQILDNQINNNYHKLLLGANIGVEFDNNSYYTLFLHYNQSIHSFTASPIKTGLSTFNFGVLLKAKDLF